VHPPGAVWVLLDLWKAPWSLPLHPGAGVGAPNLSPIGGRSVLHDGAGLGAPLEIGRRRAQASEAAWPVCGLPHGLVVAKFMRVIPLARVLLPWRSMKESQRWKGGRPPAPRGRESRHG